MRDKEKAKVSFKRWRDKNKEHLKESQKEWRQKNADHVKEYQRKYRDEHSEHLREQNKQWQDEHPGYWKTRDSERRRALERERIRMERVAVLDAYGNKCACCGEDTYEFLAIDHINGGGNKERKEMGIKPGYKFYRYLRKMGYPKEGYRILCHNCNSAYGYYGYCPHNKESEKWEPK